jgi:hypothetical protein
MLLRDNSTVWGLIHFLSSINRLVSVMELHCSLWDMNAILTVLFTSVPRFRGSDTRWILWRARQHVSVGIFSFRNALLANYSQPDPLNAVPVVPASLTNLRRRCISDAGVFFWRLKQQFNHRESEIPHFVSVQELPFCLVEMGRKIWRKQTSELHLSAVFFRVLNKM